MAVCHCCNIAGRFPFGAFLARRSMSGEASPPAVMEREMSARRMTARMVVKSDVLVFE